MRVMKPNLCAVQPSHYATIADWPDSAEATQRWAGPGAPFPLPPERFAQVLELGLRPGWALLDGQGQCLGFGQYWMTDAGTAHLGRIIVSPLARGRGLGRLLMQALSAQAMHEAGVQRLTLRVYRDNAAAVALYRDLGFQQVDASSTPELLFMQRTSA
ncbi:GNAT family N-acetyltransferase [Stenotrophomonas maltophilia]|nr:N-acetyltransferase [Stenotrophomonas maltophilia]MBA0276471.1 GNAT family N-acetyltransferase [Stenotrophomonas maltophilia]MBA0412778.1 GNAT family N-acetyltransferase [Stenotrophomonas maltophilia]MBA0496155.1 GNAT family N-acetyltransferase [Stenotrophomonas maltophilia]MBA0500853.1 GNAT family N-acetyltransferase [Stenotrophomonas maltophilia]